MATEAVVPERGDGIQTTLSTAPVNLSEFPTVRGTIDTTLGTLMAVGLKDYSHNWTMPEATFEPGWQQDWPAVYFGGYVSKVEPQPPIFYGISQRQARLDYVNLRLSQMLVRSSYEPQPYPGRFAIVRALAYARALLSDSVPTPSVVPSDDGGVSFVWHKGGWDVEVEVSACECSVWARHRATKQRWAGRIEDHWYDLTDLLRTLGAATHA